MFIYKLSRTLKLKGDWGRHVKVFTLHPGLVDTDLLNTIEIMKQYPALANQITLRVITITRIWSTFSSDLVYFLLLKGPQGWCGNNNLCRTI